MAQQDDRDRDYPETVDPKNPPNSVLQPKVRTATLTTFLGGIVVFFLIVAAALIYWSASNRRIDPDPGLRGDERGEVGTAGDRDNSPGGFEPAPRPDSTQEELEGRGDIGAPRPQPFTELSDLLEDKPGTIAGRRVDLHDVDVAAAQPGRFWIHDGNARLEVIAPEGQTVRTGQSVDVTGTVESDGSSGVRVRADHVTAR